MGLWGNLVASELWEFVIPVQIRVVPFQNKMKNKIQAKLNSPGLTEWKVKRRKP